MAPGRLASPSLDPPAVIPARNPSPMTNLKSAPDDIYGVYRPTDPDTLNLESNFGPMESGSVGFLQPTAANTPLEIMHERFERDGYLFVNINTSPFEIDKSDFL